MDLGLSDFMNSSPLRATLAVVLGRLRLPARYDARVGLADRIEPRFDADRPADPAEALSGSIRPLPYIATE
ncbi:MAG: hypothetical protein ABWZ78_02070 [Burkholderiaceae bacterium]